MFTLTTDQSDGLNKMLEFADGDEKLFILSGFAGSGKTTITDSFLEQYSGKVLLTAPTHKAVKVIREKTGAMDARTIHSALALKPKRISYKKYKLIQKLSRKTDNMTGYDIVIVDEGFMLDSELLNFIIEDAEHSRRKYIIIGDYNQLTPVNEDISPLIGLPIDHKLTKVIRQAEGSPILHAANQLRNKIENQEYIDARILDYASNEQGSIQKISRKDMVRKINNTDFLGSQENIVIAWTNKTSQKFNRHISKFHNGRSHSGFEIGDKIIFNEALMDGDDEVLINNGYEDTIIDIDDGVLEKEGMEIPYQKLTLEKEDVAIRILDDAGIDMLESKLEQLKNMALKNGVYWRDFYSLQEMFADVRALHSVTSYKSQGSTYKNVFIDGREIMKIYDPDEQMRHFYVAITRATDNVYICFD